MYFQTRNSMEYSAKQIENELKELGSDDKAKHLSKFFKTGKGEYGEGDKFLGITVPQTRNIAKKYIGLDFDGISELINSEWHEVRLCGLMILVLRFKKKSITDNEREEIYSFYLKHTKCCNNWDLVDLSCPYIIGSYILNRDRSILYHLSESDNLWEQRISIVSTLTLVRNDSFNEALDLSLRLMNHKHDLIHKAIGWVLREVGKRDRKTLTDFLNIHRKNMHRTTLRYAIEHYSPEERKAFME